MARGNSGTVWRRLDGLFRVGTTLGLDEPALLDRFVTRRDPLAFEAIVARHGAMVWGVCSRTLRDPNDAEDAFQATFLILAARAGAIHQREKLGGWLHGVAAKVAKKARQNATRKRTEPLEDIAGESDAPERRDQIAVLHEELARLPGKYREPIVLCHLEGCTHDEAAARLGWPVGTVRGRLARGRERLKKRLERRGLAVPVLALERSSLSPMLIERTVSAASGFAAGQKTLGLLSTQGAALVAWGLRTMFLKKLAMVGLFGGMVMMTGAAVVAGARLVDSGQEKDASVPSAKAAAPEQTKTEAAPATFTEAAKPKSAEGEAFRAWATKEQEIAELKNQIFGLNSAIQIYLQEVGQHESMIRAAKDRLAADFYKTFPHQGGFGGGGEVYVKEKDEDTVKNLPQLVEYDRAQAIKARVELAGLQARLAELQKNAADAPSKITEVAAQDEAQIEILRIEAEHAKDQWDSDLQEVRQWGDRLLPSRFDVDALRAGTPEQRRAHDEQQVAFRERIALGLDAYQKRADESRMRFIKLRTEIAKLEATLRASGRTVQPAAARTSANVEQRLTRIEQALERLEKAGTSQGGMGGFSNGLPGNRP